MIVQLIEAAELALLVVGVLAFCAASLGFVAWFEKWEKGNGNKAKTENEVL